ncbi:MAG: hypothetical protein K2K48_04700 [Anaeroplasmataceae bacterium]|nr:hypothetical protein [Anaeroplasmataceae bacterium]MDE6414693.1 hypothetical protein [Anaeroplasmataceae bacterium]
MKKIIFAIFSLVLIFYLVSCDNEKEPYPFPTDDPVELSAPVLKITNNEVSWEKIDYAYGYIVNLNQKDLELQQETKYKITAEEAGEYVVKVKAISKNLDEYLDSAYSNPVTYTIAAKEAVVLAIPSLKLEGNEVSWEKVDHADAYIVNLNDKDLEEQQETKYKITAEEAGEYVIKVKAISKNQEEYTNSAYSNPVTYTIAAKEPTLLATPLITLKDNIVSWEAVENADAYIVLFNGTALEEQTETAYTIDAKEDGDYEVAVKAISHQSTLYTDSELSEPVVYHYEAPFEKVPATLFVVGDSTLASFSDAYYYPRYGYGTQLSNYFDAAITVKNLALSGRSSKSFITETNYATLKNSLKAGDYLLIGFGHNDEKSDDAARFTDASKPLTDSSSFQYSLYEYYIKLAIEKGAIPILCTPIVRADKNNNYTASNGHITSTGDYAEAIVKLGLEKNVTVVNLRDLTKAKYSSLGYNEAIYYHAMTSGKKEGTDVVVDTNSVDTTHLNIYGAKYVAYLVASELKKTKNILGKYVLAEITEPTKEKDLVKNPSYTFMDYASPNLASYKTQAPSHYKTTTEGWYGTAFGDCGGDPSSSGNGYRAKENAGVFEVGQSGSTSRGKFASAGDGFAFLFQQLSKEKNFEITATAKVIQTASIKQAGFGLMLRDDCYINQSAKTETITSNYLTAGFVTKDASMNALVYRENSTLVNNKNNISSLYAVDDTAEFKIVRLGQSITTTIIYKGVTYTETYYDFDLFSVDTNYMYIGMYATRGTVVEFSNVDLVITGTSQGA